MSPTERKVSPELHPAIKSLTTNINNTLMAAIPASVIENLRCCITYVSLMWLYSHLVIKLKINATHLSAVMLLFHRHVTRWEIILLLANPAHTHHWMCWLHVGTCWPQAHLPLPTLPFINLAKRHNGHDAALQLHCHAFISVGSRAQLAAVTCCCIARH